MSTKNTVWSELIARVEITQFFSVHLFKQLFCQSMHKGRRHQKVPYPHHVTPYFPQFFLRESIGHPITRRFCPAVFHGTVHDQLASVRPSPPIFCSMSQIVTSRSSNNNPLPSNRTLSHLKPLYHI